MHEIQLDYVIQFWEAYSDNRKAFRTRFQDSHETTNEVVKYTDEDFVDFLNRFEQKGYLENTIVYVISDHGAHAITGHIPLLPDDSRFEEVFLPLFIIIVPSDIPKENLNFLEKNQQHFLNSIDIYSSLKSIAEGKRSTSDLDRSYSPLYELLPGNRDWDTNAEGVTYFRCWCSFDLNHIQDQIDEHGIFHTAQPF